MNFFHKHHWIRYGWGPTGTTKCACGKSYRNIDLDLGRVKLKP